MLKLGNKFTKMSMLSVYAKALLKTLFLRLTTFSQQTVPMLEDAVIYVC